MYYSKIIKNDTVNCIDGITVSLFMSGCPHHCKGCFNSETWNPKFGNNVLIYNLIKELENDISAFGIERNFSILGGEPLADYNRFHTNCIIKYIRKKFPNIKIYLWSGYTFDEIQTMDMYDILNNIDYLIEGRFVEKLKDTTLKLRGSSNQHIYYNQKGKLINVTDKIQNNITI